MPAPTIEIRRPQKLAALMLLLLAAQCFWVASHAAPTPAGRRYADCGRQLWEGPSSNAAAHNACRPISDGVFAYRAAGLGRMLAGAVLSQAPPPPAPLPNAQLPGARPPGPSIQNGLHLDSNAQYSEGSGRHLGWIALLLPRLPFIFFGLWLGGGLWWVARRLYGNEGGFLALALYCFSPEMIRYSTSPNNEVLAAWGAYGVIYTGIGLVHAMQGPRKKWRPRLILLALALGLTAAAHVWAAILALALALGLMGYLAEGRRRQAIPVLGTVASGAFFVLLACYSFRLEALGNDSGGADPTRWLSPVWLSWTGAARMFAAPAIAGITVATAVSLALYLMHRRSRYFGNTTPLIVAGILLSLGVAGAGASPWVWALPFVLTFTGGVFADALESRHRRAFLGLAGTLVAAQVVLSLLSLPALAR